MMNPRTLVRDLAGRITTKDHFARDGGGTIYVYRSGVYKPDGELLVRQRVKHLLLDEDLLSSGACKRSPDHPVTAHLLSKPFFR